MLCHRSSITGLLTGYTGNPDPVPGRCLNIDRFEPDTELLDKTKCSLLYEISIDSGNQRHDHIRIRDMGAKHFRRESKDLVIWEKGIKSACGPQENSRRRRGSS